MPKSSREARRFFSICSNRSFAVWIQRLPKDEREFPWNDRDRRFLFSHFADHALSMLIEEAAAGLEIQIIPGWQRNTLRLGELARIADHAGSRRRSWAPRGRRLRLLLGLLRPLRLPPRVLPPPFALRRPPPRGRLARRARPGPRAARGARGLRRPPPLHRDSPPFQLRPPL